MQLKIHTFFWTWHHQSVWLYQLFNTVVNFVVSTTFHSFQSNTLHIGLLFVTIILSRRLCAYSCLLVFPLISYNYISLERTTYLLERKKSSFCTLCQLISNQTSKAAIGRTNAFNWLTSFSLKHFKKISLVPLLANKMQLHLVRKKW